MPHQLISQAAHCLLSGKVITSPPMTSPILKSDFGLLRCELWHSMHVMERRFEPCRMISIAAFYTPCNILSHFRR